MRAKDTPNFIANRIGTFAMMRVLQEAVKAGYTVEEVDTIFGPATGRPKSAVFRTADVVGLDTLVHVTRNCYDALPGDERRDVFDPPPVLRTLVEKKWLGSKTKQGFYKKVGDQILQLDLKTLEYGPQTKPRFASLGAARGTDDVDERMRRILAGDDRAATLARTVLYETLIYSANRLGEIADDVVEIDRALRWGFGWAARAVRDLGRARREGDGREDGGGGLHACPAGCASRSSAQGEGRASTARRRRARWPSWASAAASRRFRPTRASCRSRCVRAAAARSSATAARRCSTSATGVFCLEFHSKMNAIDPDIVAMINKARRPRRARRRRAGHRQRRARSLLGGREPVRADGRHRRRTTWPASSSWWRRSRTRTSACATRACRWWARRSGWRWAAAPRWCWAARPIRASTELYIGCVEVGVGLIPAGGGCMELAARASARATDDPYFDLLSVVRVPFEMLARAHVSTSAEEARDMGYLPADATTSMSRETLLGDAKHVVLGQARAGYRPPPPRRIRVVGESGSATIMLTMKNLVGANQITEYDARSAGAGPGARRRRRLGGRAGQRAGDPGPRARERSSRCAGNQRPASASNTC